LFAPAVALAYFWRVEGSVDIRDWQIIRNGTASTDGTFEFEHTDIRIAQRF